MNSLLLAIIVLPLFNCLASSMIGSVKIKNFIEKGSMILSFAILIGLYNRLEIVQSLDLIALMPNVSLSFAISNENIAYLFLLNFIWLAYGFYAERFLSISINKNIPKFKLFFALNIALINLIILASNLLTLLFAYNLLVLSCYFLITKFLFKANNNLSKIFSFLMFSETFLLFFAIILTANFGEQIIFAKDGVLNDIGSMQTYYLFLLYFAGTLLTILSSSQLLFYKNCDIDSLLTYLFLPLFFGIAKLYIFIKIVTQVFGIGAFSFVIAKFNLELISLIFLVNLSISLFLLLFSHDFKSVFFHLFFSQLIVAFFAVVIYALYDEASIDGVIPNLILSMTLVFLTFSNLILYLKRAENKDMTSLFYDMKITSSLLLFGLLNLAGIAPALGMAEKYSLLKISFQNNLLVAQIFFAVNFACLILLTIKLFFPLFLKSTEVVRSDHDKRLAEKIDSASSLILSALVVAIIIFILPIIQFFYE